MGEDFEFRQEYLVHTKLTRQEQVKKSIERRPNLDFINRVATRRGNGLYQQFVLARLHHLVPVTLVGNHVPTTVEFLVRVGRGFCRVQADPRVIRFLFRHVTSPSV